MSKNSKIKGIIFQHDDNDYSVWMPEDKFMQFFNKYDNPNIWDIN